MSRTRLTLTINEQHRKIVQACVELEDALNKNEPRKVLAERFNDLIQYANEHFRDEEQLLERNYSQNIRDHQEEHEAYISSLLLAVTPEKGESAYQYHKIKKELLTKWWKAHIEHENEEFSTIFI